MVTILRRMEGVLATSSAQELEYDKDPDRLVEILVGA